MKRTKIKQNTPEWRKARKGKVTGSKADAMLEKRGGKKRLSFYQYIAETLSVDDGSPDDENAKQRGNRLEDEALNKVADELGANIERDLFILNEHDESIGLSPDGVISNAEMVETKCLSTKRHVKIIVDSWWYEKDLVDILRKKHWRQIVHYFIANDELETLHFASYDPRFEPKPLHIVTLKREDVLADVQANLRSNAEGLDEANEIISELTF